MVLRDEWVKRMTHALMLKHPEQDEQKLRKKVEEMFDKNFHDTECSIYNNYDEEVYPMTLAETVDWMKDANPLICESGCFFHQKSEMRSLNTEIIKECQLDARDIHKKEMFEAKASGDVVTETMKRIQQLNDKKGANSGYGAEAEKSSFLYNPHSAMSVTAAGRGQLSTMMQSMENFFGDNVKFFSQDDFMTHIMNIVNEQPIWNFDTDKYIPEKITKKQFVKRFVKKFRFPRLASTESIEQVYDALNDELRKRVYYKCNIYEFLMMPEIKKLYQKISDTECEFIDPNKIPPDIMEYVNKLTDLMIEFVNYKYSVYKYEDRSKSLPRKVIIVSDTDS